MQTKSTLGQYVPDHGSPNCAVWSLLGALSSVSPGVMNVTRGDTNVTPGDTNVTRGDTNVTLGDTLAGLCLRGIRC